jgi:multiple sugar transport system substrate-binding protein
MQNTLSSRVTTRAFKAVLGASLAGALLVSALPSASAATGSVGGVCTKVGDKAKVGKINVICKAVSGKKIWTDTKVYKVSISANAILGGKNNQTATWIQNYVIPQFELSNAEKGKLVDVSFTPAGIDDNQFKTQLALDLASKRGPDVMALDGFWVAEFAEAGYIKPLESVVGAKAVTAWDGWAQIPASVQGVMSYDGKKYGVPQGTDGRIIYFNKKLFADAGLPADWQPKSWADILTAAKAIKTKTPTINPLQLNAGDGMGEATAMQGFLNLLGGAGSLIYDAKTKKWTGNTKAVRDMLGFYDSVYNKDKVGNSDWQLLAGENGRNESFKAFSEGKLAMIIEGDYLWRGVINPVSGNFKMADRNTNVGFAKIPAKTAKSGVNGQSFISMSGGSGYALNPNSANKTVAWDLLKFINAKEPVSSFMAIGGAVRISQRQDVNTAVLKTDPCLKYVFENAIPNTFFRPANVNYNAVSVLLQKATTSIVQGKTVAESAAAYETALKDLVGAANVASN